MKHDDHENCGCNVTPEQVDTARRRLLAGAAATGAAAIAGSAAHASGESISTR